LTSDDWLLDIVESICSSSSLLQLDADRYRTGIDDCRPLSLLAFILSRLRFPSAAIACNDEEVSAVSALFDSGSFNLDFL
jgi:hypothetical protein